MDDLARFREMQSKLGALWPLFTMRSRTDAVDRTLVVIHSVNTEIPAHLQPVVPSYEERYLAFALSLLRHPGSRFVYVTSQPILPRIVEYYLGLMPDCDTALGRRNLTLISVGDANPGPLTPKILSRPLVLDRIKRAVPDPDRAFIIPFQVGPAELELSLRLGIPVYGPDPSLEYFGTKIGGRKLFAQEGVPHPLGLEDVRTIGDVVEAAAKIQSERPAVRQLVVKLDASVGGLGNAILSLDDASTALEIEERARRLQLEDDTGSIDHFYEQLAVQGGIVEERITGAEFRSPSVQARVSPAGGCEILSTHDQLLGGPHGQSFYGCTFPADEAYAQAISVEGMKIASRLAREGVIGRFGIDFVVARGDAGWEPYAIEINLRNGGTTHPLLTLQALTDGGYEPNEGLFRSDQGTPKYYVSSDHLDAPAFRNMTPDDVLDLTQTEGLRWDARTQTGVVLHLISSIAVGGRIGVLAVGDSREEADARYAAAGRILESAASADPDALRAP